jgi:hypothetical protein
MLACDAKPSAQGAESLGIPDGTYTRTITTADIQNYGADPGLNKYFAGQEFTLVFAGGFLTVDGVDGATGEPEQDAYSYSTYDGRIRLSGPIDIVATYAYDDGELRFSDFTLPSDDEWGYEATFGFFPTPWVRQD